ncbi:MAG: AAA family ATPase [Parvibaculaceae bacterium]
MKAPRLIQVASGKGGVGKTWASITLADALAADARKVLLFDGDFGLANIDVQLGLAPKHDLGSVIAGRAKFSEAITKYSIPSVAGSEAGARFDVLAGKSGSGALSSLTRDEVENFTRSLALLSDRYDHIVTDLASGLDATTLSLCVTGSTTLVIVTDEPTSLTDAYAFIKLLSFQDPAADIRVIVNMTTDTAQGHRTYAALTNATRNFLGLTPPLAGIIPRDDLVRETIRNQSPLLFRHPQSKAAVAMRKIAKDLSISAQFHKSETRIVASA